MGVRVSRTAACAAAAYPTDCQKRAFEFPIPAEYQIQLRDYGRDRLIGCELLPAHYD